jgi:hypothetical protein
MVRMTRSQWAFIRGACGALLITCRSSAWKMASNVWLYLLSRSPSRNRSDSVRCPRSVARFLACCVVQAWLGWAVTPVMCKWKSRAPVVTVRGIMVRAAGSAGGGGSEGPMTWYRVVQDKYGGVITMHPISKPVVSR